MPRFVPCRISHLTQELARGLGAEAARFWELSRVVEGLYHHYAGAQSRLIEELYVHYDPDAETVPAPPQPHHPEGEPVEKLMARLEEAFLRANFARAESSSLLTKTDAEVLDQLAIDAQGGIEHLAVYHRGLGSKAIRLRRARRMFRLEEQEIPTYRRVAIVVRTEAEPEVQVKLFKDVPQQDLELLLPTVRVKMNLLDKLKLSGSGSAAAISAWKTLRLAYRFTPTIAKLAAVPFKLLLLPILVLVGGIYGGKTVLDYTKIKASYVTALAEHLYAITMASNRAALARVCQMVAEEETKEVVLGYGLLLTESAGLTAAQLRVRAETFLWDRYRARVGFDIDDAVAKLHELELVREEGGRLVAVPLEAALRKVDAAWDDLYVAPARAERRLRRRALGAGQPA